MKNKKKCETGDKKGGRKQQNCSEGSQMEWGSVKEEKRERLSVKAKRV